MKILKLFLAATLALSAFSVSCSGSQTTIGVSGGLTPGPNGPEWTVGVQIGVSFAQAAAPHIAAFCDTDAAIPAPDKARMDQGFTDAENILAQLKTAADALVQYPTVGNECRVHFLAETAITELSQSVATANGFGARLPAQDAAAIGGLATLDDILFPVCAPGSSSPPPTSQRVSAAQRWAAVLR